MSIPSKTDLEDFPHHSEVTSWLVNFGSIWYFLYINILAGRSLMLPKTDCDDHSYMLVQRCVCFLQVGVSLKKKKSLINTC